MKKRIPKPIVLPLNMKRLDLLELPGQVALLALDQPWLTDGHLADLAAHLSIAHSIAKQTKNDDIQRIAERAADLMSDPNADADTIKEVRRLVGVTLPWMSQQSNILIQKTTEKFLRETK